MARRISFFPYHEWDSDRCCMAFIALVDGARARCLIRADALVALAQESAMTPVKTFSEHRAAIEELARRLILNDRLDGCELMIRLSDVHENRADAPALPLTPPSAPQPVSPLPACGRQMTMTDDARIAAWRALCDRQKHDCELICDEAPTELAAQARADASTFETQNPPGTAHELNLRRVEAGRMKAAWRAELSGTHRMGASHLIRVG